MSTSDWTYNYPQGEQTENYEQEPQQMQLSDAELFAYQCDYTMQAANAPHDAPHSTASPTYWPAEQDQGTSFSPTASSSTSPWPVYDAQQIHYQASPLTLAEPSSFASPTLAYTYAHSHPNEYTQPMYDYAYEHVDAHGYPLDLDASSTANEYSLGYPAGTSAMDTIGPIIPSAIPSTSSSSLAAALTFPSISAAPAVEADHSSIVIEHEHDTVYDGESSYGHDGYGYQYDDQPAHVGGDIDTHNMFEEGSAPSYAMHSQVPASSDVVHAAAQVLAPAPKEREVDPEARVLEVITAATPWMDHLPYQPRYTINSASKDIADLDAAAMTSHLSVPTTAAAMDRHGAPGPSALDLPTSPSAFGLKREDTTESTPAVFHIKHEADDDDDHAETAATMMSALNAVSPIAMSAPCASTSTSVPTGCSHSHATSNTFISRFAAIQPFAHASGSRIKIDDASDDGDDSDDDDDEYVMPGKGKGRARAAGKGKAVSKGKGKGKAYTKPSEAEGSHRDRERERQRKQSAAKAAVMRQLQACAGSHAAMDDEDQESQASGSGSGAQTQGPKKKKPFLACFFCRGRKIACGPPPPGSADRTCNQCARRHLICTYPLTSRRGQRRTTTTVQEDA